MRMTARTLSLVLCLVMLAGLLLTAVSCGKSGNTETTTSGTIDGTTAASDNIETTTDTTAAPAPSYEPAQENFGDANGKPTTFTMMVRANRYGYLFDDGTSPERVNAAAYQRNMQIEERYNIKFEIVETEETAAAWNTALLTSNGEYDLGCFDYWWGIEQSGLLYDLAALPEIDTTDPHWYAGWNDNCTINGKLFSIAGDATLEVLENIEILFFNKAIADANQLDLYSMVNNGEWTMEKMGQINAQVAANLDNDTTDDDTWGALYDVHSVGTMLFSSGMKLTNIANDGTISINTNNDSLVALGEKCINLLHGTGVHYDSNTARSASNQNPKLFINGSSLFYATALYLGKTLRTSDTGFDYGVLVPPKADANADYITSTYGASLFGIPNSVKDPHKSAVILDALNYYSKDTVVDAFYEIVLKYQVADSQDDADMIEQARQTLVIDFAFINDIQIYSGLKGGITKNQPLGSILSSTAKISNSQLNKLVAAYQ